MKILCFGVAKDIMGSSQINIDLENIGTVSELRSHLFEKYPELSKYNQFMIAVNQSYAEDDQSLVGNEEIAIIPPVSGG